MQTITVSLSEKMYHQIARQSRLLDRSVEEHVAAIVRDTLVEERLPPALEQELADLDLFTDAELWQAAQMIVPEGKGDRMQDLLAKQQLEGLTEAEQEEAQLLGAFFDRIMLLRAKAAALLKEHGHNVDRLRQ